MLRLFARLSTHYPRRVLAFWGVLLLIAWPFAGRAGEVLTTDSGVAPNSEAQGVRRALLREFSGNNNYQLLLVATTEAEADTGADTDTDAGARRAAGAEQFGRLLRELRALDAVETVVDRESGSPLPLPDLSETGRGGALVTLTGRTKADVQRSTTYIQGLLPEFEAGGLELYVTGSIPVDQEVNALSAQDARRAELMSNYEDTLLNPYVAADRGYIDQVIRPSETRVEITKALRLLANKRQTLPPKKHGNIPL